MPFGNSPFLPTFGPVKTRLGFRSFFVALAVLVFIFVQLPFSLLHLHEHEAIACSLYEDHANSSERHFHESESHDCFLCKEFFLKKINSDIRISLPVFFPGEIQTGIETCSVSSNPLFFSFGRGPPSSGKTA
jgi:hypothetical protein